MSDSSSGVISGHPVRVLVVDDHELSRRYTVAALRQAGLSVKAAATPSTALRTALTWLPDAVFVDIHLPAMDGYEWMARLRQAWPKAHPQPRLIVLSAGTGRPRRRASAAPRADAMLRKPASPEILFATLCAVLTPGAVAALPDLPDCSQQRPPGRALTRLFHHELAHSLQQLDHLLFEPDLPAAGVVVHRLIASSRMCHARRLEERLRALHAACNGGLPSQPGAGPVAHAYHQLLACARPLLDPGAPSG